MRVRQGDVFTWERTFTKEEVHEFGELTRNTAVFHVEENAHGHVMAHGLLTASIPTKIGGDLNYMARQMTFEFIRPVFTGDTIRCELRITRAEQADGRQKVEMEVSCCNQHDAEVLRARSHGVIAEM
jgi:3-hydroxybutyryl-CoA dehydratase